VKTARFSEPLVSNHDTTWCHNPEDLDLNLNVLCTAGTCSFYQNLRLEVNINVDCLLLEQFDRCQYDVGETI
jgi:hypothetical protein